MMDAKEAVRLAGKSPRFISETRTADAIEKEILYNEQDKLSPYDVHLYALQAIYHTGYIEGIRAERRRHR